MKNSLLFLLSVLVYSTGFAQKKSYTDQEFVLREVTMTENSASPKKQLQFSFKIYGKYTASQLAGAPGQAYPSYMLRFWLADAQGDTLVSDKADPSLLQRFSFFTADTGDYKAYSFGHTLSFPYGAFRKTGQQTFVLWAQPQNTRGDVRLPAFKTGSYTVTVPKIYSLADQQVQLKQAAVTETAAGISIHYGCTFLYSANEVFTDNETSDEVIFYAEFTRPDGSPVALLNDPKLSQNGKNAPQYSIQHQSKGSTLTGEIKMPYTRFYLPEGQQEVHYVIHAVTPNGTRRWENLYQGKTFIHMPPVYLSRVVVKNIRVADRSYDVAAKDIPIINLFVSSKNSRGQGRPDLFWRFGSEGREILSTGVIDNSLMALDDSCFFQMMENERLTLGVYDYDLTTFNDKLAFFNFPPMHGDATYRAKLSSGDVLDGQILIERKRRPAAPGAVLQVQADQNEGVSGYRVWGRVTDNSSLFQSQLFLRLPDGTHTIPAWQKTPAADKGEFSGFIPAWDYPPDAKPGLLISDKQFNLPLAQQYATPDKRLTETRDVQLQISNPQTAVQNGVRGLLLTITARYPAGMSSKNIFRFLYSLRENGGIDLKPLAEKGQLTGSPLCNRPECGFTLFVPYFLLSNFSGKTLHAVLGTEVQVAKNSFTVGKNEKNITLAIPELLPAPAGELSANVKFKKSWTYVEIATEYNGQKKVLVKEKAEGGKWVQDIRFPAEYVCGADTLSLLITPYEFRTAQPAIRWDFTADQWKKAGMLKLEKSPQVKKPLLKIY